MPSLVAASPPGSPPIPAPLRAAAAAARRAAWASALAALAAAGCASPATDAAAPPGSNDGGAGGGGVTLGGAQDLGELRAILSRGDIPGPRTLDAAGFFAEHYAPLPPATCGGALCLSAGLAVGRSWLDPRRAQAALQLAITTSIDPATAPRLPMRLVVVVDRSGSMAADQRLEHVKRGLATMIDELRAEDRLALLSFDDTVTVEAPFGAALDRAALKAKVAALQPRGGTNLFEGLRAGLDLLGAAPASELQHRVIFLSDGLATVGVTSADEIAQLAASRVARGIGLTTIGVGNDFDGPLMRRLAERGAGNFYYLESAAAADEVFREELAYFMRPIALDLEVEATVAGGWTLGRAVGSTLWAPIAAAPRTRGALRIPAVFLASRTDQGPDPTGGRRGGGSTIFLALDGAGAAAGRVADLRLSYRAPGSTERVTHALALDYARDPREVPAEPYLSAASVAERYAMYNMYLGLEEATAAAQTSYDCALAALLATRAEARAHLARHEADQDLAADLALLERFADNLGARGALPGAACAGADGPLFPCGLVDEGRDSSVAYACAAGGGAGALPVAGALLAALAGAPRRRRRRRAARRAAQPDLAGPR
jgi:Ca-activated chloride channel family protein